MEDWRKCLPRIQKHWTILITNSSSSMVGHGWEPTWKGLETSLTCCDWHLPGIPREIHKAVVVDARLQSTARNSKLSREEQCSTTMCKCPSDSQQDWPARVSDKAPISGKATHCRVTTDRHPNGQDCRKQDSAAWSCKIHPDILTISICVWNARPCYGGTCPALPDVMTGEGSAAATMSLCACTTQSLVS